MKMRRRKNLVYYWVPVLVGLLIINLYACKPSREDNDLQSEHANTYLTKDELEGYEAWEEKESFEGTHLDLLQEADSRIVDLETYLKNTNAQTQGEIREITGNLKEKRHALEVKLTELKQTKNKNWKQTIQEVDQAADSLKMYIEKVPLSMKHEQGE